DWPGTSPGRGVPFAMMSLWASGAALCALLLPPQAISDEPPADQRRWAKIRALLPNVSYYVTAFRLLRVPAVVLIVLLGALMHVGNSVQGSFYVAWLNELGMTGTAIG